MCEQKEDRDQLADIMGYGAQYGQADGPDQGSTPKSMPYQSHDTGRQHPATQAERNGDKGKTKVEADQPYS